MSRSVGARRPLHLPTGTEHCANPSEKEELAENHRMGPAPLLLRRKTCAFTLVFGKPM